MIGYDRGFPRTSAARLGDRRRRNALQVRLDRRRARRRRALLDLLRPAARLSRKADGQDGKVVPGGYAALGVPWEQGQELPVGFTKKTIGFPRVANNCAVCHTTSYRAAPDANPVFVVGGPAHTTNVEGFFRYLIDCAKDPRFNADILMAEINRVTDLDFIDQLLYRFFVIPITKKRLLEREQQFAWIYRPDFPGMGPRPRRRDEPDQVLHDPRADGRHLRPDRHALGVEPQEVRLGQRPPHELRRRQPRRLLGDHGLGTRPARRAPANKEDFVGRCKWLHGYLAELPPPKYPFAIDAARAAERQAAVRRQLRRCHASELTGRPLPLAEVGTDRGRLDSWNKGAAIKANQVVKEMGLERRGLVEEDLIGYVVPFLDGIWLKAPYLHNGSVPTLRDLLEPVAQRPTVFWRGYDVYDQKQGRLRQRHPGAQRVGTKLDTQQQGWRQPGARVRDGVVGGAEKEALVEYLKTL
jgi:hypothetical protein